MDRDRVPARFGVQEDTGLRSENQREWQEQRRISRAMMATSKARRQRMPVEPTDTRLRSWVRVRKTNRTVPLILVGPRADTLQNWVSWGVHVHTPPSRSIIQLEERSRAVCEPVTARAFGGLKLVIGHGPEVDPSTDRIFGYR